MREIIRASAWGGFADLVAELGGDVGAIYAAAKIDARQLADPERYLPLRSFLTCQAMAASQLRRNDFGLLFGQKQNVSMLGALSIAILNSPTARDAIEIAGRFMHVHNPAFMMSLTRLRGTDTEFLSCVVKIRDESLREQNDERILSNVHKVLQTLGGAAYRPHAVRFLHEQISPVSVYRRVFGVTPQFGKPAMGIVLSRRVLDSWRPGGSDQMREVAERYLLQQGPSTHDTVARRVANMARSLMRGGEFTPEQAARALGLHARTLQRRLREESSTFEQIKDVARREWAEELLMQPSVSLTQIADMLGYADSSAFSRSCRRWFGEAPRIWRARMTAKSGGRARMSRVNSLSANLNARRRADV